MSGMFSPSTLKSFLTFFSFSHSKSCCSLSLQIIRIGPLLITSTATTLIQIHSLFAQMTVIATYLQSKHNCQTTPITIQFRSHHASLQKLPGTPPLPELKPKSCCNGIKVSCDVSCSTPNRLFSHCPPSHSPLHHMAASTLGFLVSGVSTQNVLSSDTRVVRVLLGCYLCGAFSTVLYKIASSTLTYQALSFLLPCFLSLHRTFCPTRHW